MKYSSSAILCLCLAAAGLGAKLPHSFKKCNIKQDDFNECLLAAVVDAVKQLDHPFKEVGLTSLMPVEVPSLVIGAGSGTISFVQNLKDIQLHGLENITCLTAAFDPNGKSLELHCAIPKLTLTFRYDISGKMLMLPVFGNGPGTLILDELDASLLFNLDVYEKMDGKHYKVVDQKLTFNPKKMIFTLENLFDGDKLLGDNINKVMSENWKEVYADVGSSYEEAFGKVFGAMFNALLGRVPIRELFGEE